MVRGCRKFAPELQRTKVRRILIPQAMPVKRLVRDAERKLTRLSRLFPHGEGVLAHRILGLETAELHHDFVAHLAPAAAPTTTAATGATTTFFFRLARERLGGVPSAGSTTIRPVTNFFV